MCFPHACGDVPILAGEYANSLMFSPRVWGCTDLGIGADDRAGVFPTRVGMYRKEGRCRAREKGFPHACGDVPVFGIDCHYNYAVFPTRVGMYRREPNAV